MNWAKNNVITFPVESSNISSAIIYSSLAKYAKLLAKYAKSRTWDVHEKDNGRLLDNAGTTFEIFINA